MPNAELNGPLLIAVINGLKLEWLAQGERSRFADRIPEMVERLAELFFPDAPHSNRTGE